MTADDEEFLQIRFSHLTKLIGSPKLRLIDNSQLICEPHTKEEADEVVAMMRPIDESKRKKKPWWKSGTRSYNIYSVSSSPP